MADESVLERRILAMPEQYTEAQVTVKSDYDGFFEKWLRGLLKRKQQSMGRKLRHKRFIITAGAWRFYDLQFEKPDDETLAFDFYSVIREFGGLGQHADSVLELL